MKQRFGLARPSSVAALVLSGSFLLASPLRGQFDQHPIAPGLPQPDASRGSRAEDDPLRDSPELRDRLQRGRAAERQRRIVDDANRLVELTVQYRKALDAHGTATADDQKLLTQIEKLAREVKDRMRGM